MTIKLSLIDNDFVVRAETALDLKGKEDLFKKFFSDIGDELVTGKTACLEIEGLETESLTLEVSRRD
jgi:hypothetical protein